MPDVRSATPGDLPRIGAILAAAFVDDPEWNHITAPRANWPARAAAWFEADARAQLRGHGEVLVDEAIRGVAIWSPPGHWRGTAREAAAVALPSARLFGSRLPRAIRLLGAMERAHPSDPPHWFLALLGTDPTHQGIGVGSALIRTGTERCDEQGLGAYLESSKAQNVAFYARHGFEVSARFQFKDGPPSWLMWRRPRT